MKLRKVYQTKDMDLSHAVLVNGNRIRVNFTGSNPSPKRSGTFITEDEKLQAALEEDSYYGVLYVLQSQCPIADSPAKPLVSAAGKAATEAAEETAALHAEGKAATVEDEELEMVTNFNKAREYLRTTHNVQMGLMPNTQAVLAVAAELGVRFPNWTPNV